MSDYLLYLLIKISIIKVLFSRFSSSLQQKEPAGVKKYYTNWCKKWGNSCLVVGKQQRLNCSEDMGTETANQPNNLKPSISL